MVGRRLRVAVFGGDGRHSIRLDEPARIRVYRSPRDGGSGDLRALMQSLKSGGVDRVFILAHFNGHSATNAVRRLCRKLDVPVETLTHNQLRRQS